MTQPTKLTNNSTEAPTRRGARSAGSTRLRPICQTRCVRNEGPADDLPQASTARQRPTRKRRAPARPGARQHLPCGRNCLPRRRRAGTEAARRSMSAARAIEGSASTAFTVQFRLVGSVTRLCGRICHFRKIHIKIRFVLHKQIDCANAASELPPPALLLGRREGRQPHARRRPPARLAIGAVDADQAAGGAARPASVHARRAHAAADGGGAGCARLRRTDLRVRQRTDGAVARRQAQRASGAARRRRRDAVAQLPGELSQAAARHAPTWSWCCSPAASTSC